jgi:hypothetical protein
MVAAGVSLKRISSAKYKAPTTLATVAQIDPLELTFERPGKPDLVLRAADFPNSPITSRALLGAFYERYGNLSRVTLATRASQLRAFLSFLAAERVPDTIDAFSEELLDRYRQYLTTRADVAPRTRYTRYKTAEKLVILAAALRSKHINARRTPVRRIAYASEQKPHLSPHALIRILTAAKQDVRDIWEAFDSTDRIDPASDLGQVLQQIQSRHGGVVPKCTKASQPLWNRIQRLGGFEKVARHLHATVDNMVPFVILIIYETVANVGIVEVERNCIAADPLFETRRIITWNKRRAKREQRISRDSRREFSAPALIDKVARLTGTLTAHALPIHRNRLFLVRSARRTAVLPLSEYALWVAIKRFLRRHDLREEDDSPVYFSADMLRPTVLAEIYRRTGDLILVNRVANHADLATTFRYVVDRVTDELHDAAIADVQSKLAEVVRAVASDVGADTEAALPARKHDFDCVDPYNGRGASRKGTACPTWLFPYTHDGLVVPNERKYVINIIRQLRQFEAMRMEVPPARFELLYADVVRVITNDILPALDPRVVSDATLEADDLPPLPVFHE